MWPSVLIANAPNSLFGVRFRGLAIPVKVSFVSYHLVLPFSSNYFYQLYWNVMARMLWRTMCVQRFLELGIVSCALKVNWFHSHQPTLAEYDGETWFKAADVDIDHLVPLKEAWVSGAYSWTTARRRAFANDLDRPQLIAVTVSPSPLLQPGPSG